MKVENIPGKGNVGQGRMAREPFECIVHTKQLQYQCGSKAHRPPRPECLPVHPVAIVDRARNLRTTQTAQSCLSLRLEKLLPAKIAFIDDVPEGETLFYREHPDPRASNPKSRRISGNMITWGLQHQSQAKQELQRSSNGSPVGSRKGIPSVRVQGEQKKQHAE